MHDVAANPGSPWLLVGGSLSVAAALLHIACIFSGPEWYRFFGAGERMAHAAEQGMWTATAITLIIGAVLLIWAAFAFSAAGWLPRLPLLRTGLVAVTAIYLLRGLVFVPLNLWRPTHGDSFAIWSSVIVLIYGIVYAVGTVRAWPHLSPGTM